MLQKSLGNKKSLHLCFLQHKISRKQGKNDRVPTFFFVFSEKNIEKV